MTIIIINVKLLYLYIHLSVVFILYIVVCIYYLFLALLLKNKQPFLSYAILVIRFAISNLQLMKMILGKNYDYYYYFVELI